MRLLLNLAAFLVLSAVANAATITGYIIDHAGAAKTGQITIKPLSTPQIISTQYVSGALFTLTLTNGSFTNTLLQGDYQLIIGNQESPIISVPSGSSTYNFIDLINTNGLLYAFKMPGAVVKLDQYDSTFGFLGDKLTISSPLTFTTNNFGANESVGLSIPRGTNGTSGYLHSSDWSAFNAKVSSPSATTLGPLVTGATVSLNATNYLEIVIAGVTNKVGLVQ